MKRNLEDRVITTERVFRFAEEFINEILDDFDYDLCVIEGKNETGYMIIQRGKSVVVCGESGKPLTLDEVAEWIDSTLYND